MNTDAALNNKNMKEKMINNVPTLSCWLCDASKEKDFCSEVVQQCVVLQT